MVPHHKINFEVEVEVIQHYETEKCEERM
jgi:hypothetical protein